MKELYRFSFCDLKDSIEQLSAGGGNRGWRDTKRWMSCVKMMMIN